MAVAKVPDEGGGAGGVLVRGDVPNREPRTRDSAETPLHID
jgi:hypothetical protein